MVMAVEAAIITEILLHCMRLFNNGGQRGGAVGVGGKDVEEQEKADHRRKVFETLKSSMFSRSVGARQMIDKQCKAGGAISNYTGGDSPELVMLQLWKL